MSKIARYCALWAGSWVNQKKNSVCRPLGALLARRQRQRPSDLVWSGVDNFVRGTWRPHLSWWSSLVENGIKVTVIVFTEETWLSWSNTLRECFDNVDIGVPLWLTEPRDKSSCREFASSHPTFTFPHFILAILVCLYFLSVVSC